jgi:hypothetical protein
MSLETLMSAGLIPVSHAMVSALLSLAVPMSFIMTVCGTFLALLSLLAIWKVKALRTADAKPTHPKGGDFCPVDHHGHPNSRGGAPRLFK